MLLDKVSKRVEVWFTLTAANHVVQWLSRDIDIWTLSKISILFTVILVYLDYFWSKSSHGMDEYFELSGIMQLLQNVRKVSIMAVSRILLIALQGQ